MVLFGVIAFELDQEYNRLFCSRVVCNHEFVGFALIAVYSLKGIVRGKNMTLLCSVRVEREVD